MDRKIVYAGSIPQDTDILAPERYAAEAIARVVEAVMGGTTLIDGLTVAPNSPLALSVVVSPGAIYAPIALDATSFGSLAADSRVVMHQGLLRDALVLAIVPPGTAGQSRVYLVQVALQVIDTDPSVLPYYNAANPSVAWSGPGNSGTPQNTRRSVVATVSLKAGTAAVTGTETAPSPDAGNTGLANVTVANGATTVVAGNIVALTPRRVPVLLPDVARLLGATVTTMTTNTSFTIDQQGIVLASAAAGNRTATLPLANAAGANVPQRFIFARTDATANTLTVARAGADTIEGLTSIGIEIGDRVTLVSDGVSAWRRVSATLGRLLAVQKFTASGTYTPTPGATRAIVEAVGSGGAGGGVGATGAGFGAGGGGGGAGAYGKLYIASGLSTQTVTIGAGVTGGTGVGANGNTTSFGALLSCPGGTGGGQGVGTNVPAITSNGGGGGTGPATTVGVTGQQGTAGFAVAAASVYSGAGGSSPFGNGGVGTAANGTTVGAGVPGQGSGSGGGGAIGINSGVASSGGNSPAGMVLVWEYA